MTLQELILGGFGAFVFSWLIVAVWIRFSLRTKIVDIPNPRSSHVKVTPRGGGVAIVATMIAGTSLAVYRGQVSDSHGALWAGGLALFIAIISFIDDVHSLSSILRLGCQCVAAALAVATVGAFPVVSLPLLPGLELPAWFVVVATFIWIVGMTNVYNFMDGIDGLAGAQGVVAGSAWACFGYIFDAPIVAWGGVLIAASCLGFLVYNWSPAKVFMGDVGSAFLGFAFAVLPLLALHSRDAEVQWTQDFAGGMPVFAALVVWPFLADGLVTFLRRVRHKRNLLEAHRTHLYQRFTVTGWGHAPVTLLFTLWAVASSAGAAFYLLSGSQGRLIILLLAALSLSLMYGRVKREELRMLARLRAAQAGTP